MMCAQRGITLPELIAALAILGLALSASGLYLTPASAPLEAATVQVESYFRQARFQAIATTAAQRVRSKSSTVLEVETARSCSDTIWTGSDLADLEIPDGVSMLEEWGVCFNTRGLSSDNITVALSHSQFGMRYVEVLLGGTTRVIR